MWYNNRGVEVRPTMVELAGIFKKSTLFQIFPSNFLCPPPADFFPKSSAPQGRCYVNLVRSDRDTENNPHMAQHTVERAGMGRPGPSSPNLDLYGLFFY